MEVAFQAFSPCPIFGDHYTLNLAFSSLDVRDVVAGLDSSGFFLNSWVPLVMNSSRHLAISAVVTPFLRN